MKEKAKHNKVKIIIGLSMICAILIMCIGYATINSIILNISGKGTAKAQSGVYITDVENQDSSDSQNNSAQIINFINTTMHSKVIISSSDEDAYITEKVTIYNSSDKTYWFKEVAYDAEYYNNEGITFEISNFNIGDKIETKQTKEIYITFKYKNNTIASTNQLESYLNFKMEETSSISVVGNSTSIQYTGTETSGDATVDVTKPSSGYTIQYGTTDGTYTSDSMPKFTDIGTYTVYYKITALGYDDYEGNLTITITKADLGTPTVSIDTDGKITWNTITGATSYEISFDNSTWSTSTSGSTSVSTSSTGTKTAYVRAISTNSNYNTPSAIGSKSVEVYSLTLTAGTGISATSGAGNYVSGKQISISATVKTGYTWSGWTKSSGTAPASTSTNATTVTIKANTILVAKATINSYTLTINPNSGSYNSSTSNTTLTRNYGDYYTLMTPTRTGYTANGWTLSGYGVIRRGIGNGSATSYSGFTKTDKTENGENYTNYSFSTTATSDTYYYLKYPNYSITAGHTYEISFYVRVNTISNAQLDIRHSCIPNDYSSTGRVAKTRSTTSSGWVKYVLTRTYSSTTIDSADGNTNVTANPLFEIYTSNLNNSGKTTAIDLDIRDIVIKDTTDSTYKYTQDYIYTYTAGNGTVTANWTANKLTFADKTISTTYSTSSQTSSVTAASNGTGTYTYTEKSENKVKDSSGTAITATSTSYITLSGTTINIDANTPAGTYQYVITATDSNSGATKDATYTITINKATNPLAITSTQSGSVTFGTSDQTKAFTSGSSGQGTVTYTIKSQTNSSGTAVSNFSIPTNTTASLKVPGSTGAGTYTIVITVTAAGNDNYKSISKDITYTLTISKATNPLSVTSTQSGSVTYSTSDQTKSFTAGSSGQGTVTYTIKSQKNSSGTAVSNFSIPTNTTASLKIAGGTGAGTYTIVITTTAAGNDNYNSVSKNITYTLTINKATGSVTAPTAKSLTYTGSAQTLANAGSSSTGTIQYSSDNSTWSTTIPTGTSAGKYTVYYKVVGDSNHNDVASASISVTIATKAMTVSTTNGTATYSGSATSGGAKVSVTVPSSGATIKYGTTSGTYNLTSIPTYTNAGTYTVYYQVTATNYTTKTGSFTIKISKANGKVTLSSTSGVGYPKLPTTTITVTNTSGGTLSVSSSDTSIATATVSGTTVTINSTAIGSATITVTSAGTDNYNSASATYSITQWTGTSGNWRMSDLVHVTNDNGTTLEIGSKVTGYTANGVSDWYVLGVEEDENKNSCLLITTKTNGGNVELKSSSGAGKSGTTAINNKATPYLNTTYGSSARGINVDDINKITGYNPHATGLTQSGAAYGAGTIFEHGLQVTYTHKSDTYVYYQTPGGGSVKTDKIHFTYLLEDETWSSLVAEQNQSVNIWSSDYYYYPQTCDTTSSTNTWLSADHSNSSAYHSTLAYNLLFSQSATDTNNDYHYWLNSIFASTQVGYVKYGRRNVEGTFVNDYGLYESNWEYYTGTYGTRPVIRIIYSVKVDNDGFMFAN